MLINYPLQPGTRVTLKLDDPTSTQLTGTPVSSLDAKREGYYWGYTVTIESKFHRLLDRGKKIMYYFIRWFWYEDFDWNRKKWWDYLDNYF